MSVDKPFTKENLDSYLKELAKEFRKKKWYQNAGGDYSDWWCINSY